MKISSFILSLAITMAFTNCKKDTVPTIVVPATPATTTTTTPPFVEYRDSFVGNYIGTYLSTTVTVRYPNYAPPIDTTCYLSNVIGNIAKLTSNDSALVFSLPNNLSSLDPNIRYGSFKINSDGEFIYSTLYKYILSYTIQFKNDSLYLDTKWITSTSEFYSPYVSRFRGKKQ